jgi:hypothetical protein
MLQICRLLLSKLLRRAPRMDAIAANPRQISEGSSFAEVLESVRSELKAVSERNWDEWDLPYWQDLGCGARMLQPAARKIKGANS